MKKIRIRDKIENIKSQKGEIRLKKNKKYIFLFLILLILTNIIFIPFLKGHMATDLFNIFNKGYEKYTIENSLLDGRIFAGLITEIMDHLQIPIVVYSSIILEIAIIISCVTIMILAKIIKDIKKPKNLLSEVILYIAIYYTIFNVLYIENMYYIEAGVMAISLLFYILAAKILVEQKKGYLIKAFFILCLGIMSYQGTISMFFLSTLVFSMCLGKNYKEIIKIMLKAIGIAISGVCINNIQIKMIEEIYQIKQERGLDSSNIIENIECILMNAINIIKVTGGYFPKYTYIIIIAIIESCIFIKVKKQNDQKPDKRNQIILFEQIAIILLGILFSYSISIINTTSFFSGRIRFSMGALVGFMWIHLWVKTDFAEKNYLMNRILVVILILYGLINTANYSIIMLEHKEVNRMDEQAVLQLKQKVEQYERKNQIKVTKIAVVLKKGQTEKAYYKELYYKNFIMHSAMKTEWSIIGCYNYYTGEKLKEYKPSEEEKSEYLAKNQEDYLCIGDILYITAYMY